MKPEISKKIFLTGASSGIGLAIAKYLTAKGYDVWGTSRNLSRLPTNLQNFHPVELDLNNNAQIENRFLEAQSEAGGKFNVVINNAGDGWFGPSIKLPAEILQRQFQTLVFAPTQLMQLALSAMRRTTSQSELKLIINITSLAGRLPLPYAAAYNAAKAAMSAMTATFRMEECDARSGVRIIDLQPGDISTNFNRAMGRPEFSIGANQSENKSSQSSESLQTAQALQKVLRKSDQDVETGPSPDVIAKRVCQLIQNQKKNPAVLPVGMFSQATLGPIGLRILPTKTMHSLIRKHFELN